MNKKTIEEKDVEIAAKIKEKCHSGDNESDHLEADHFMRELLLTLGCSKTVEAWDVIKKWYA